MLKQYYPNESVFSINCRQGMMADTGYDVCNACIDIVPAPKAIHLNVRSEASQEVELAMNPEEAGELIFKLHRAIHQHYKEEARVNAILSSMRGN